MTAAEKHREHRPDVFTVKLTTLSIVLLCVTVSSLASLVVVTTITKADALSTVALALAVLAFAAQLIVTIAQAQSSAEQTRDTFRINAETKAVLAELQAQGKALVALQSNQFDKLLDRAINADTVGAALTKSTDTEEGEEGDGASSVDPALFALQLRSLIEESVADGSRSTITDFPSSLRATAAEARAAVEGFLRLSPEAQELLMEIVDRDAAKVRMVMTPDSPRRPAVEELQEAKFVRWRTRDNGDRPIYLSSRGELIKEILDPYNPAQWSRSLRKMLNGANHVRMHGFPQESASGDNGGE